MSNDYDFEQSVNGGMVVPSSWWKRNADTIIGFVAVLAMLAVGLVILVAVSPR